MSTVAEVPSAGRVSVMGRNALDALGQQIAGRRMAHVTQTDDADHPLALVHHRQPAELQLLHVMHRLCEVIVLPATMDAFGHHIARLRAASIEVVARKPFADDIAVGHHPDQSVILPDWNAAAVTRPHQFRKFGDWNVWADPVDTPVHHVFDFHGGPPLLGSCALDAMQHGPPPARLYNRSGVTAPAPPQKIIPARPDQMSLLLPAS